MTNGVEPAAPAKKKGLPTIAWVAIGCGGIILIGLLAFAALGFFAVKKGTEMVQEATGSDSVSEFVQGLQDNPMRTAAETAIRLNPELELVETDEEAGTITFQNNRTGEQATLNFEDIAQGRFSVSTEEGEYSIDASEGVTVQGPDGETSFALGAGAGPAPDWVPRYPGAGEWSTMLSNVSESKRSGAISSTTSDAPEKVMSYYKDWFEQNGYTVSGESMTRTGQGFFGNITGRLPDDSRRVTAVVTGPADNLQLVVNYEEATE